MARIGNMAATVSIDAKNFMKKLDEIKNNINNIKRNNISLFDATKIAGVSSAFSSIGGLVKEVGKNFLGIVKDSLMLAGELEQIKTSFNAFTHDVKVTEKLFNEILQYAVETPFEIIELSSAAKQLFAYGFAANEVADAIRLIGDIAAATKQPLGELAYLIGTTRTQQVVYMRDIVQFGTRGIPIIEALGKQMKLTNSEVIEAVSNQKVTYNEIAKALNNLVSVNGLYFNQANALSATFLGKLAKLKDSFNLFATAQGQAIIDVFKLNNAIDYLTSTFEKLKSVGIEPIKPLLISLKNLAMELAKVFISVAVSISQNWPEIQNILIEIINLIKDLIAEIRDAAMEAMKNIKSIAATLQSISNPFGEAIESVINLWKSVYQNMTMPEKELKKIRDQSFMDRINRSNKEKSAIQRLQEAYMKLYSTQKSDLPVKKAIQEFVNAIESVNTQTNEVAQNIGKLNEINLDKNPFKQLQEDAEQLKKNFKDYDFNQFIKQYSDLTVMAKKGFISDLIYQKELLELYKNLESSTGKVDRNTSNIAQAFEASSNEAINIINSFFSAKFDRENDLQKRIENTLNRSKQIQERMLKEAQETKRILNDRLRVGD